MFLRTWLNSSYCTGKRQVITFENPGAITWLQQRTGKYPLPVSEVIAWLLPGPAGSFHVDDWRNLNRVTDIDDLHLRMKTSLGALARIRYANFMRETTDEQLMQQYAQGDAAAFDQLYTRHRAALYRYFKRQINDEATVNDLYQGTWEKMIKARNKYRSTSSFTAWMYRIAHNHLVDHYRRIRPIDPTETDALTDDRPEPSHRIIISEQNERLRAEIISLPMDQKTTLLLKLETGLKLEEIATVTGVSRETVKSRLRYAVNKLKRSLQE